MGRGCEEVEAGVDFVRSQDEQAYKRMVSPVVAYFLTQLVTLNDSLPYDRKSSATFAGKAIPEISIEHYMDRIIRYTPCSPECFHIALIHVDKLIQTQGLFINSYNIHRILLISVMVAAKLYDDTTYNNKYYARVGGIALSELNALEAKYLRMINYNLVVCPEEFELYTNELENCVVILGLTQERETEKRMFTPVQQQTQLQQDNLAAEDGTYGEPPSLEQARYNAHLLSKQLRRTRSFNNTVNDGGLSSHCSRRKQRSTSFNIMALA